jgi:UDP-N-acetylglucosamine 2-epimerase (non-hydrolysing)
MNPAVREVAYRLLEGEGQIRITEPLDVLDFHNFLARSYMVLTDSGGIQEEAPALGKLVVLMRETTERPEGIKAGTVLLSGTSEAGIYESFTHLLEDKITYEAMSRAQNPYGDGFASRRIADILEK